jgi:hypothetical protein
VAKHKAVVAKSLGKKLPPAPKGKKAAKKYVGKEAPDRRNGC